MIHAAQPQRFKFIDIFAGCGGLSLGLLQAGWDGVFAVERDPNAFQTLHDNLVADSAKNRFKWPDWLPKSAQSTGEILEKYKTELRALENKIDLIVGGPPCQGFSSAGRRDPNDPRNRLVESYLEFVSLIKPKIVLIENVKGITQDFDDSDAPTGKINYSKWIIESLSRRYVVSTQMIDTSDFGVPQRRKRFIVIGIRKDITKSLSEKPFDIIERFRTTFLFAKNIASLPVSSKAAISDLEVSRNGRTPSKECDGFEETAYIAPLTSYQRLMHGELGTSISDTRLARHKPEIVARFKQIIAICHADGRLNVSLSSELKASFGLRKSAIRVLDPDKPSPTITSMPDDLIHYKEPRALTVRENARLQSFPDWFAFKGKYTTGGDRRKKEVPRFTQVANAVPPLVAEAIGLAISQMLDTALHISARSSNLEQENQKSLDISAVPA